MSKNIIHCGSYTLDYGKKSLIMGILNVTPDSFRMVESLTKSISNGTHAMEMVEKWCRYH